MNQPPPTGPPTPAEPTSPAVAEPILASAHCPLCGAPLTDEQSWCLECGAPARTRIAPAPNWRLPVAAVIVAVLLSGAGLAYAFVKLSRSSGQVTRTTTTPIEVTTVLAPTPTGAPVPAPTAPPVTVPPAPTTTPTAAAPPTGASTAPSRPSTPTTSTPSAKSRAIPTTTTHP